MPHPYDTWATGSRRAPPAPLVSAMQSGESLLWAATLPSGRTLRPIIWLGLMFIPGAVLAVQIAPWAQTMAEYCANDQYYSCRKRYRAGWPLAVITPIAWTFISYLVWKAKSSPWNLYYGVSTSRALMIDGRKPKEAYSKQLDQNTARVDWLGTVWFGHGRTKPAFITLEGPDANRAVYFANEGRFSRGIIGRAIP